MNHRLKGYAKLRGFGIEIGAFHQPAPLPKRCKVEYVDAVTKQEAIKLFPEVEESLFVDVQHICDLDKQGLEIFGNAQFDFVVLNHVIEHVANPIRVIEEVFRVVRDGGVCVISAPDKRFTFDKNRDLTAFEHLLEEYRADVRSVDDDHYVDFILGLEPGLKLRDGQLLKKIDRVRKRREHAHVWDTYSFRSFLESAFEVLEIRAVCLFESTGDSNRFEHFSVWRKYQAVGTNGRPSRRWVGGWLSQLVARRQRRRGG